MKAALFLILLAAGAAAQQVRVTVRVIEVPHAELTKWTAGEKPGGPKLHDRAVKLALAGGAEIVDTNVLVVRSGERAVLESIAEMTYPTDWDPPDGLGAAKPPDAKQPWHPPLRPTDMVSFETRNAGTTLELEPVVFHNGGMIDLRLSYETVDRDALETWVEFRDEWGDASVRMPVFGSRRAGTSVTLRPGHFELANVFTPKPAAAPAAITRQLVFVAAELLPFPSP